MATSAAFLTRIIALVALFLVLAVLSKVVPGAHAAAKSGRGPVELDGYVRVMQGDTLDAMMLNRRVAIGVIGVQVPQGNTPCGQEATEFVQALVSEGAIVEEDPSLTSDGRYRLMYHVSTLDGRSVAEELVAAGLARANGQGANSDRLAELETEARAAQRGCVWSSRGMP